MNTKMQQPLNQQITSDHLSFLLRLWRIEGNRGYEWRASLESPGTGQRIGFASLEQLFGYLMDLSEHKNDRDTPDSSSFQQEFPEQDTR